MKTKIKAQLKGVGFVVLLLGLVFAGVGLYGKSRHAETEAHGITKSAEITAAAEERGTKGKKRYIFTVEWNEDTGRQSKKFATTKEDYQRRVDGEGKLISANISVKHLPGKPDTAILEGSSSSYEGVLILGYVVTLLGAVLLFFGIRAKPDPAP